MNQLSNRWGPGPARVAGRLALLGWWIYTGNVDEILAWVILTVFGWWFIPLVREFSRWLWWPAKIPPPPFRICCGRDYRGWASAPGQIAVLVLGPPLSGKTRGVIIPNVAAWGGAVLVTSTRRDVLDATAAWRTRATQLCAVLLHAAALEDRPLATVCAWAHAQRAEPAQAFCQRAESQAALALLKGRLRTPDRERGSIWSALQGMLSPFDTSKVCQAADATPEHPFDPDELGSDQDRYEI
ncbi:MAG: type IV secretory system conjugative DNA transfer family protein [Candidatus Dormibacteraeota bacterium]|nr:type IV secretory system conjugative DNA transfer family protein [Candidatus Dormibacteraeota bacterium]